MRDSGIFFGGLIIGLLLSAAIGFDLFPSRRLENGPGGELVGGASRITQLEGELIREKGEKRDLADKLRHARAALAVGTPERATGVPVGAGPYPGTKDHLDSPGGPGAGAAESTVLAVLPVLPKLPGLPELSQTFRAALLGADWTGATGSLGELLSRGVKSYPLVVEAIADVLDRGMAFPGQVLPYPLARFAASHEDEIAELVSFVLDCREMADPRFASLFYRLAPPFFAASTDRFHAQRAALVQRLLATLERGPAESNFWWVLEGLDTLKVDAGVDSLRRILNDPSRRALHGIVIVHLARVATPESARVLVTYIDRAPDARRLTVMKSLQVLADLELPEAREAVSRYLGSEKQDLRDAAFLAYFSRPRERADVGLAAAFLDSNASVILKRKLCASLRDRSAGILFTLRTDPSGLRTAEARQVVLAMEVPAVKLEPVTVEENEEAIRPALEPGHAEQTMER